MNAMVESPCRLPIIDNSRTAESCRDADDGRIATTPVIEMEEKGA